MLTGPGLVEKGQNAVVLMGVASRMLSRMLSRILKRGLFRLVLDVTRFAKDIDPAFYRAETVRMQVGRVNPSLSTNYE